MDEFDGEIVQFPTDERMKLIESCCGLKDRIVTDRFPSRWAIEDRVEAAEAAAEAVTSAEEEDPHPVGGKFSSFIFIHFLLIQLIFYFNTIKLLFFINFNSLNFNFLILIDF